MHADDVAGVIMAAIENWRASTGESFNAVSGAALTLRGFAEGMAEWFGRVADLAFELRNVLNWRDRPNPIDPWRLSASRGSGSFPLLGGYGELQTLPSSSSALAFAAAVSVLAAAVSVLAVAVLSVAVPAASSATALPAVTARTIGSCLAPLLTLG